MQDTEAVMPVNKKTNVTGIKTGNSGFSINGSKGSKALIETIMEIIFFVCAIFAVIAVAAITIYDNIWCTGFNESRYSRYAF